MVVNCPTCEQKLRLPDYLGNVAFVCPQCQTKFYWDKSTGSIFRSGKERKTSKSRMSYFRGAFALLVVIALCFIFFGRVEQPSSFTIKEAINEASKIYDKATHKSDLVKISYSGLVDRATITHSGETVGEVVHKLHRSPNSESLKGLVQPYLEPYSFVCNEVVSYLKDTTDSTFRNITDYYPVGSQQPAWASLFREGHYQLFFDEGTIRLFLKGKKPGSLFDRYHSVIRHPLRDLAESFGTDFEVEVYAYQNDYTGNQISLDVSPYVIKSSEISLAPQKAQLDIESYEDFFNMGVIPEAIEVEHDNYLYFYGRKGEDQTIAGTPLSLADLAVIYRGVFHYANNPPYISLDKHEDNRYAKVNFGGFFEDTEVGSVVLESDKLFKTLSTGIDPNTYKIIRPYISSAVKGFMTEDERSLMDNQTGSSQIRYWFYPDEISTVTDGKIGAVEKYKFLADVERMDVKSQVGTAQRTAIDHLNNNYDEYAAFFRPFRELNTIGRLMALVNWLKGTNIKDKIDLDALLSVPIPAFRTPSQTRKMLAVTGMAHDRNYRMTKNDLRKHSKVYYLSDLIDKTSPSIQDEDLIKMGGRFWDELDKEELLPREVSQLKSRLNYLENQIDEKNQEIERLERSVNRLRNTTNGYSSTDEINNFNMMIDNYNYLVNFQKRQISEYNRLVNTYNSQQLGVYSISSVGGGIDLRPESMKVLRRNSNAKKLQRIKNIKNEIVSGGKLSTHNGWIRSKPSKGQDGYLNKIRKGDKTKGVNSEVVYDKTNNSLRITRGTIPYAIQAKFKNSNRMVVLGRAGVAN